MVLRNIAFRHEILIILTSFIQTIQQLLLSTLHNVLAFLLNRIIYFVHFEFSLSRFRYFLSLSTGECVRFIFWKYKAFWSRFIATNLAPCFPIYGVNARTRTHKPSHWTENKNHFCIFRNSSAQPFEVVAFACNIYAHLNLCVKNEHSRNV